MAAYSFGIIIHHVLQEFLRRSCYNRRIPTVGNERNVPIELHIILIGINDVYYVLGNDDNYLKQLEILTLSIDKSDKCHENLFYIGCS